MHRLICGCATCGCACAEHSPTHAPSPCGRHRSMKRKKPAHPACDENQHRVSDQRNHLVLGAHDLSSVRLPIAAT